jgi:hypothetical protein
MTSTIVMSVALLVVSQVTSESQSHDEGATQAVRLARPTRIRLDFDNRTLAEIVAEINARAPESVMLPPEPTDQVVGLPPRPTGPQRRLTLHEPGTVPFWEGIDRICKVAERWPGIAVMRNPSAPLGAGAGPQIGPNPKVILVPTSGDRGFACNDGAFRIVVARLSYGRDIRFAPTNFPQPGVENSILDRPGDLTFFTAELIIMAEPRLKIDRLGDLTVHEATDDRGQSLLIAGSASQPLKDRPGLIPLDAASTSVPLTLSYPRVPGKRIKRLRGTLLLEVSARKARQPTVATVVAFDFSDVPMP